jgi:hypothetical protein
VSGFGTARRLCRSSPHRSSATTCRPLRLECSSAEVAVHRLHEVEAQGLPRKTDVDSARVGAGLGEVNQVERFIQPTKRPSDADDAELLGEPFRATKTLC